MKKQQPKPSNSTPKSKTVQPKMVTVGRLKQVRDSLVNKAKLLGGGGDSAYQDYKKAASTKKKDWLGRSAEQAKDAANRMWSESRSNYDRADRYSKIIKNAEQKAKKK